MRSTSIDYAAELQRLASEWQVIAHDEDPVPHWQTQIARLNSDMLGLKASGQWRSGRRTLLSVLGVHHDEVLMCRGLAWLLTPDGWHGLGSRALVALLDFLDVDSTGADDASVVVEEARDDTRADIVVRFGSTTLLIEAKIWAFEQPRQCDRLAHYWADEAPTLVFLTRTGSPPTTAIESKSDWRSLAWSDLASLMDAVATEAGGDCDPGMLEYVRTMQIYGGRRA